MPKSRHRHRKPPKGAVLTVSMDFDSSKKLVKHVSYVCPKTGRVYRLHPTHGWRSLAGTAVDAAVRVANWREQARQFLERVRFQNWLRKNPEAAAKLQEVGA